MNYIMPKNSKWIALFGLVGLASFTTNAQDVISISTLTSDLNERWPQPATVVIRRSGGVRAVTVPITFGGSATKAVDYASSAGSSVTIPVGAREVWVQIRPLTDGLTEPTETVQVQVQPSAGFTVSGNNSVSINLLDNSGSPTDDEATRFLIQAGFGADPDELAEVKALGFEGWINQQITRPKGYLQPVIQARRAAGKDVFHPSTKIALWTQAMRRRNPPGGGTVQTDVLRQRVTYSLLQIFVISQNVDALLVNSEGVTNYYDRLMDGAFGNFRQLLFDVTMHPCMGVYLSHVGNRKPDPSINRFPDENYAREIMQLFSIGLWELNQDGTRKLDGNGQPIPTYTNRDITQFARVFTGFQYGGPTTTEFDYSGESYLYPMKVWDREHDMDAKTLLRGTVLPARTYNGANTQVQGMLDVNAAIDNLFNHPNVGPFIGRLLIQRLVTSNPSPAYISRVAGAFNNNGSGVRGDMGAVVKAILLDPEARSFDKTLDPAFGKMREPYMTLMNMAKTFNAQPQSGDYESATYMYDFYLQEPFQSPSVFNFYSPNYRPFGELTALNLYAPEFQILTAVTAIETQNNLLNSVENQISRWGATPQNALKLDFSGEIPLANDPDALIRRLSTRMTGGTLRPRSFQNIREAVLKITTANANWQTDRIKMAAYLIGSSSEFNIQK
ncbi:MAG: DUF1800 family protein [Cytophagales bacterium]|nr:MAG: DUF1800 family protein [Cytophagales bacterium]